MSDGLARLLAAAIEAGDVPGLAAAVENVLAVTADPYRMIGGDVIREAIELGLSGSETISVRMSEPIE